MLTLHDNEGREIGTGYVNGLTFVFDITRSGIPESIQKDDVTLVFGLPSKAVVAGDTFTVAYTHD